MTRNPSREPLRLPFGVPDVLARFLIALRDTVLGMQERAHVRSVVLRFPSDASGLAEENVFRADRALYVEQAMWSQGAALAPSGTDYWTFDLTQRHLASSEPLGTFDTSVVGLTAQGFTSFGPLRKPILKPGARITLAVSATGAPSAYGPGELFLVLKEIDL